MRAVGRHFFGFFFVADDKKETRPTGRNRKQKRQLTLHFTQENSTYKVFTQQALSKAVCFLLTY